MQGRTKAEWKLMVAGAKAIGQGWRQGVIKTDGAWRNIVVMEESGWSAVGEVGARSQVDGGPGYRIGRENGRGRRAIAGVRFGRGRANRG